MLSALETGLVESGLRNLHYGDRDSQGWRQERAQFYKNPTNLRASINRYFDETAGEGHHGRGMTAAQLAQRVQGSAFPSRYAEVRGQAKDLKRWLHKDYAKHGGKSEGSYSRTTTKTIPGIDRSGDRKQLKLAYLENRNDPNALLSLAQGLKGAQDTPSRKITKTVKGEPRGHGGKPPKASAYHGVANFEGHKVAAWIKPYLVFARKHGWKGSVQSGYRSYAKQYDIYYRQGIRPAAVPGTSMHEGADFPRGAIDVSDAATFARIIKRYPRHRLQWAGSKDPVHFSHPENGRY